MFKKPAQRVDKVDTVIGPGTEFEGHIKATGIVRIDGKVTGKIETSGDVVIGDQGELKADVSANNITIGGKIFGNVNAKEKATILQKGFVEGDIETKNIAIEDGATFKGRCIMGEDKGNGFNAQKKEPIKAK
ncbi:hypothetical protein BHU72_12860 [Desulfuribacillus stibiiarsenatis]|uniref:Cell shape determination protein CcmA n=1 Tax=Desulfuribacillus stibiiarsenatis TaxID=1390249 RepID=A0A1E5L931_9FIRM|nr:polymer-forming cytoskeletal protein [Desulfuribacillus stibiiarsenatis]OEH86499.1 hypothetical protein BHU72_12860 [Desulfuribacillus stibiiarsenatis]